VPPAGATNQKQCETACACQPPPMRPRARSRDPARSTRKGPPREYRRFARAVRIDRRPSAAVC
jgi:hypothetical protein